MKNAGWFQCKHCLVLGMAKSGYAAASLLHRFGATVVVNDAKPLENHPKANELTDLGIKVIGGGHPEHLLDRPFDFIVKNPGIPYHNPIVQQAMKNEIPVITEVEIAGMISNAEIIAITGSNGKTTTTSLVGEMLQSGEKTPVVAGNIGTVLCDVAAKATEENLIVAELSSFQLMGTRGFHPKVAVFLNLFDAHLDYHGSRKEYGAAKAKIFANQTDTDFAVFNADDPSVSEWTTLISSTKIPFSLKETVIDGAYLKDEAIFFCGEYITEVSDVVLPGQHNLENVLAAVAVAKITGIENKAIANVLKTFSGVKHRLQYVDNIQERLFYNDSKATNILATSKAVSAFHYPVILLAGGLDRGNDFSEFIPVLKSIKAVVTFGETAGKIVDAARKAGMKQIKHVDNVEQAVLVAYALSKPEDVILLSPACASWDQYQTFEERGDIFIESVHKLR